jgi:phosphotransferase system HPr-like phosphotransfer protein
MEEKPCVRIWDKYTLIDVIITAEPGFGTLRGMVTFFEECKKYKGTIYVKKAGDERKINCKDALGLLSVCGEIGEKLEFEVEGIDKNAEDFALRLYSGVTSESIYRMNFDRFNQAISQE